MENAPRGLLRILALEANSNRWFVPDAIGMFSAIAFYIQLASGKASFDQVSLIESVSAGFPAYGNELGRHFRNEGNAAAEQPYGSAQRTLSRISACRSRFCCVLRTGFLSMISKRNDALGLKAQKHDAL